MKRAVKHSQHGVLAWRINTSLHTGTHMNAPINMVQLTDDLASVSVDRLFGNGIILDLRNKKNYDVITAEDLKKAGEIKNGDIVVINTGWHHKYSDGLEYYGEAPGLSEDAAQYLVSKNPKFVAMDTPFIDHPLATSMGPHRGGPQMHRLAKSYQEATGKDPKIEHGKWYIAQKTLSAAGIPTIEQVGGDVDAVTGKRATMVATPWKLEHGDACPVRFVAMFDPSGSLRIDAGK
jgi:kynurenine formamidase